ncbi:unnamed protein product [Fraxinus pennsylvanica]|uniref:Uncharacterized protein n=1 Tax=Fraxinus pennsylvanica TaxID=56036 RepID=A0AAD1ZUI5_9LAMI|nr:unnamed protein product [Fraxinus pennsylvanica]
MKSSSSTEVAEEQIYDRISELIAFDETKAGVKGLVDAGITKVPRIFFSPVDGFDKVSDSGKFEFCIPVIDLDGVEKDPVSRKHVMDKVRDASETWGFFQPESGIVRGTAVFHWHEELNAKEITKEEGP